MQTCKLFSSLRRLWQRLESVGALALLLSSSGCGPDRARHPVVAVDCQPNPESPWQSAPLPIALPAKAPSRPFLDPVRAKCDKAGGRWEDSLTLCLCPRDGNQALQVFSALGEGSCGPLKIPAQRIAEEFAKLGKREEFTRLWQTDQLSVIKTINDALRWAGSANGGFVVIELSRNIQPEAAYSVVSFFQEALEDLFIQIPPRFLPQRATGGLYQAIRYLVGAQDGDFAALSLDRAHWTSNPEKQDSFSDYVATFYISETDGLAAALGDFRLWSAMPWATAPPSMEIVAVDPTAKILADAFQYGVQYDGESLPTVVTRRGDGCDTYCTVEQPVKVRCNEHGGTHPIFAWLHETYVGGAVFEKYIFVSEHSDLAMGEPQWVIGRIDLDRANRPISFFTRQYNWNTEHLLQETTRAYSASWRQLLSREEETFADYAPMQKIVHDLPSYRPFEHTAVLQCDGRFFFGEAEFAQALIRGPFATTDLKASDASLLGWFEASLHEDATLFAAGLLDHFESGTDAHGSAVAKVLIRHPTSRAVEPDFRVIPVEGCLLKPSELAEINEANPRIRVLNLSMSEEINKNGCEPLLGDAVRRSPLLWVLAAGNALKEGSADLMQCPAALGYTANGSRALDNFIAVGYSVDGVTMADDGLTGSNFGVPYVDIAANGYAVNGYDQGTSFAAPRVAHTAARIASTHPHLSNKAIRFAILLSARLPTPGGIAVRSGGLLDYDKALTAAGFLGDAGAFSSVELETLDESVARKLLRFLFGDREAEQRLQLLRHRGIFDTYQASANSP